MGSSNKNEKYNISNCDGNKSEREKNVYRFLVGIKFSNFILFDEEIRGI